MFTKPFTFTKDMGNGIAIKLSMFSPLPIVHDETHHEFKVHIISYKDEEGNENLEYFHESQRNLAENCYFDRCKAVNPSIVTKHSQTIEDIIACHKYMNSVVVKNGVIDPLANSVEKETDFFVHTFKANDKNFVVFSKENFIPVKEICLIKGFSSKEYLNALSFEVYGDYAFTQHELIRDDYVLAQVLMGK